MQVIEELVSIVPFNDKEDAKDYALLGFQALPPSPKKQLGIHQNLSRDFFNDYAGADFEAFKRKMGDLHGQCQGKTELNVYYEAEQLKLTQAFFASRLGGIQLTKLTLCGLDQSLAQLFSSSCQDAVIQDTNNRWLVLAPSEQRLSVKKITEKGGDLLVADVRLSGFNQSFFNQSWIPLGIPKRNIPGDLHLYYQIDNEKGTFTPLGYRCTTEELRSAFSAHFFSKKPWPQDKEKDTMLHHLTPMSYRKEWSVVGVAACGLGAGLLSVFAFHALVCGVVLAGSSLLVGASSAVVALQKRRQTQLP